MRSCHRTVTPGEDRPVAWCPAPRALPLSARAPGHVAVSCELNAAGGKSDELREVSYKFTVFFEDVLFHPLSRLAKYLKLGRRSNNMNTIILPMKKFIIIINRSIDTEVFCS